MAGSLNKVLLIGNLGADPEIRNAGGSKVANFSIATSESWRDKDTGEKKERTEWHRITVWNEGLVGVIERYIKKGDKVFVEGQLQTRKWQDQDGNDRYSTEVVLSGFGGAITMLSGGCDQDQGNRSNGGSDRDQANRSNSNRQGNRSNNGGNGGGRPGNGGGGPYQDDDIPFAPEWR